MKNKVTIALLFTIFGFSIKAQNNDSILINNCFKQYKNAIQTNNGAKAYNLIDSNTINWYARMLDLIKFADSSQVSDLNLNDKLTVLISRQTINHDSLASFSTRDYIEYTINKSNSSANAGSFVKLGAIHINDKIATSRVQVTSQGDIIDMVFRFEDGQWKYDLTSIFDVTNHNLKKMILQNGLTKNEYALKVLEQISGTKLKNEVWFPIK